MYRYVWIERERERERERDGDEKRDNERGGGRESVGSWGLMGLSKHL